MVANRRNFIFRVSIVINVIVLFYTALHLSGTYPSPQIEWVQITSDGSEKSAELRDTREYTIVRNDTESRTVDSGVKIVEELTSQITPSTMPSTNKTTSSTASIADVDSKALEAQSTNESLDENAYTLDENVISETTYSRLRSLLACKDRYFLPEQLQRGEYWVLKNYIRAEHGELECHETITYTTHAGYEFLDNVLPLVERWLAPVSLAIHAPGTDLAPTVDSIRYLRDCLSTDVIKQYVTFHIFIPNKHIPENIPDPSKFLATSYNCTLSPPYMNVNVSDTYMKQKKILYPVNVARNIARDAALTHFILPSDIELYPSPNLVPKFLNMIARNASPLNKSTNPRVFPISLFEVAANVQVPSTKTELQAMLEKKIAIPFHKFVCQTCHNLPQGQQWMKAPETSQMDVFHIGKREGKYVHWEPIFIGTHQDPHYDDRLSWEGKKDKMTQGYILCVKNYDFMILNNAFLIHKPGIKHYKKDTRREYLASKQTFFVKNVIMPELRKLFGTKTGCAL
ncbi:beta-1,4-glucuronyltransferase 1-like [Plodia interpunctella]|uniref:beta-1,4-glucuronyltransferase 1-like n=1 Tax=Plodia interpunctella TaxID=58824 RepID=UPI002368D337|nr:beta-1,4-glucuronyltransferase 1-like [Plodia interpunctella]XP_053600990.1 beta-1,4-glucuronyltransferase 1-like [Plodia interpunctella]